MNLVMKSSGRLLILLLLAIQTFSQNTYFIAPYGNDSDPGNIYAPFKTITKAAASCEPGDIVYLRGGIYDYSSTQKIAKSGTNAARISLFSYRSEVVVLDFSSAASGVGIQLSGSYWHIKGIQITRSKDNGMHIQNGGFNIIEFCAFYENGDTGLQIDKGANNNQIINCDSYFNVDATQGNADGFAIKLDVGTGNIFKGCRAWQNSDDGWDGYLRPSDNVTTTLDSCWAFKNGFLKSGAEAANGNGNGFKIGGSDDKTLRHNFTLTRCFAFDNKVKGFDQNNNKGSIILKNCTGFRNKPNYGIPGGVAGGSKIEIINCISYGGLSGNSFNASATLTSNSWQPPFSVTDADFLSTDTTGARSSRTANGTLPNTNFMHLTAGSDLIDAGANVGLLYNGSAIDLGSFETASVVTGINNLIDRQTHVKITPNPSNTTPIIHGNLNKTAEVQVEVLNIAGASVLQQNFGRIAAGSFKRSLNVGSENLPAGLYMVKIRIDKLFVVRKLMITNK